MKCVMHNRVVKIFIEYLSKPCMKCLFRKILERISPKNFARKKHSGPEQWQSERSYNLGQSHPHQQLGRGMPQSKNSTSFWRWHLIRFAMPPSLPPSPQFRSLCCRSSCADTLMSSFEQGFDASFHHARRIHIGAHSLFYRVAEQIHFRSSKFYFIFWFNLSI